MKLREILSVCVFFNFIFIFFTICPNYFNETKTFDFFFHSEENDNKNEYTKNL